MEDKIVKIYGITTTLSFPCICYGSKAYFCKIAWAKKHKAFRIYTGHIDAESVVHNWKHNMSKWKFFGVITFKDKEE